MRELWLGVRLALRADGAGRGRMVAMTAGVAASVALLLIVLSVPTIVQRRNERILNRRPTPAEGRATVLFKDGEDLWDGVPITRLAVAVLAATVPPPGVTQLPDAGETVVSPALAALMAQPEAEDLRSRYGTHTIGTIGPPGLAGPDELVAYIGVPAHELRGVSDVVLADGFGTAGSQTVLVAGGFEDSAGRTTVASFFVFGLLIGMFIVFLSVSVRLSARSQDRRIAAMRLAGASAVHARLVVAGEILIATVGGTLLGVALFLIARAASSGWEIGGIRWDSTDMSPGIFWILVLVGVPLLGHVIAQTGARGAVGSALSVRRGASVALSSWKRLTPLIFGLLLLLVASIPAASQGLTDDAIRNITYVGMLLSVIGMALALPVIIRLVARGTGRAARSVPLQLSARRLDHEPTGATRMAVGVGLAVTIVGVVSGFVAVTRAADAEYQTSSKLATFSDLVRIDVTRQGNVDGPMRSVVGVHTLVPLTFLPFRRTGVRDGLGTLDAWVIRCEDAMAVLHGETQDCPTSPASTIAFAGEAPRGYCDSAGHCGAILGLSSGDHIEVLNERHKQVADLTLSGETTLPAPPTLLPEVDNAFVLIDPSSISLRGAAPAPRAYLASTDGSPIEEQHIRTAVLKEDPLAVISSVLGNHQLRLEVGAFTRAVLTDGALLALIIAVIAEVVAGLDALWDRRRQTAMLLSTGIPDAVLRRSHAIYLILPLLLACALGTGIGALIDAGMDRAVGEPVSISGTLLAASGLVCAFTAIVSALMAHRGISMAHVADAVRTE